MQSGNLDKFTQVVFGAKAQVVVGILFLAATIAQTIYWTWITPPTVRAIFLVSMEALAFASYSIIATGLGFRATERVEAQVADVGKAEKVEAENVNVEREENQ